MSAFIKWRRSLSFAGGVFGNRCSQMLESTLVPRGLRDTPPGKRAAPSAGSAPAARATCWLDSRAPGELGRARGKAWTCKRERRVAKCGTRWMLQSWATIELRGVLTLVGNQPAPGFVAHDSEFCNFNIFVSKEGMIFWTVEQPPQIWFRRNT